MRLVTTKYQLICNTLFVLFWVMATYNFITQEIMGAEVRAVELGVRLLAQGVIIFLGLWTLRARVDKLIIIVFCLFSLVSTLWVNNQSFMIWIDGIRLYVGFIFVLPVLRYLLSDREFRDRFITRMDRTLFRFLVLQFPCIVWQFFRYSNYDLVGGTLGYMMSGVISNLIYLSSFYLMLRRWDTNKSYLANLIANRILLILLLPSFLNETKISFVFLLMYFFFLIPMDKRFIKRLIWITPLMIAVLGGAMVLYLNALGGKSYVNDSATAAKYLVGDEAALNMVEGVMEHNEDAVEEDFARGLKLAITPAIMNRHPSSWIWGYGLGQYKVGDSAAEVPFAKQYQWLLKGTMIQGHIFWLETGLTGVGLYFLYWLVLLKVFKRRISRNKQLQWFLGINVLVFTVYNAPFLVIPYVIIFLYMMLVSTCWASLPPYRPVKLLGSRPINWSIRHSREAAFRKEAG